MTITFPKNEYKDLLTRLNNNQIIYTTRISNEVNKYQLNEIYDSPFGKLKVVELHHFLLLKDHPFLNELTNEQINEINTYITNDGYDLIGLIKIKKN